MGVIRYIARVRPLLPGESGPPLWIIDENEHSLTQEHDVVIRKYFFDFVAPPTQSTTDLYQVAPHTVMRTHYLLPIIRV
jgi:hypothetical protein